MEFQIVDKKKKEIFVSIFNLLKNFTSFIHCICDSEWFHIQGMDKSHVCLFDVKISKDWFDIYVINESNKICFDSTIFYSILNMQTPEQNIVIKFDYANQDSLYIQFVSKQEEEEKDEEEEKEEKNIKKKKEKKEKKQKKSVISSKKMDLKKFFKIPLAEFEYEEMNIPVVDYDAEFIVASNLASDIFSQLNNFGNDIIVTCLQEEIEFTSNNTNGEMRVQIPIDDLSSYSIVEDEDVKITYSLLYLTKMCTNKLSEEVEISLSNDSPLKIMYSLGNNSTISFYMASKITDE